MPTPNLLAITTVTPKVLASAQASAGDNAIYTVGANKAAKLTTLTLANASFIPAPVQSAGAGSGTGGTLAAATYYYVVTATTANGETLPSNEINAVTTGTTSSIVLTWAAVPGAAGYKVYRGTAASTETALIATIGSGATVTTTDTGGAGSAATPPSGNTTGVAVSVSVSVVPSGGTVDNTHKLISGYGLSVADALVVDDVKGMWLGAGDGIVVSASLGSAADVVLTGLEFS
jgi:hypothetical protein